MKNNSMDAVKALIAKMKKTTKQKTGLKGLGKFKTWMSPLGQKKKDA